MKKKNTLSYKHCIYLTWLGNNRSILEKVIIIRFLYFSSNICTLKIHVFTTSVYFSSFVNGFGTWILKQFDFSTWTKRSNVSDNSKDKLYKDIWFYEKGNIYVTLNSISVFKRTQKTHYAVFKIYIEKFEGIKRLYIFMYLLIHYSILFRFRLLIC